MTGPSCHHSLTEAGRHLREQTHSTARPRRDPGAFQPISRPPELLDTPLPARVQKADAHSHHRRAECKRAGHPARQSEGAPGLLDTPPALDGLCFSPRAAEPYVKLTVTAHPHLPLWHWLWNSPTAAVFLGAVFPSRGLAHERSPGARGSRMFSVLIL